MVALLSCDMDSTDKVVKNISDCREQGIEVLPPDINTSGLSFTVVGNSMRFGMGAVKNVGSGAIEAILEARKSGLFTGLYDFCERVDLRRVNKRVIESLIKCGAFDSTNATRAAQIEGLEAATNLGQRIQQERDSAQVSLFGTDEVIRINGSGGKIPDVPEWHDKEKLAFEKESLGFLITGHPLDRYVADIKRLGCADIAKLTELADGGEVRVCGIVVACKEFITKKSGERMCFASIEDLTGTVEITVFSDIYATASTLLKSDDPLLVTGKLERGEKGAKILVMGHKEGASEWQVKQRGPAGDIKLLQDVRAQTTKKVLFNLRMDETPLERIEPLKSIIERHRGSVPTYINFVIAERSSSILPLENMTVQASDDLRLEVERLFGYNAATFE